MIAADGGASHIRKGLNIDFNGKTASGKASSFDARVITQLDKNTMYMFSSDGRRLVLVPTGRDIYKISGRIQESEPINTLLVTKNVQKYAGIEIDRESIKGLITYNVHARIASNFRINNIFLIGDAAHVFYPAGGYGLNVAVKDAFMLGNALTRYFLDNTTTWIDKFEEDRMQEASIILRDSISKINYSYDTNTKEIIIEKQVYND